jgi:hypothetical protein
MTRAQPSAGPSHAYAHAHAHACAHAYAHAGAFAFALALALALTLPACKQQDAALRLEVTGQYLIPSGADGLLVDAYDGPRALLHRSFPLTAGMSFPLTVVLVEAGEAHPSVRIVATLYKGPRQVGSAAVTAQFADGATVEVPIAVAP